ncbi:MAG: hypothetical protein JRI68_16050 [Deltaproteobacteria bacterium]|nr:hypothetical protein [Deltaproteobacteria bacterium]
MLHNAKPGMLMIAALLAIPVLTGAKGQGCANSPAFTSDPAPDMTGAWDVTYDDRLDVEITIGGVVYEKSLGVEGGAFTIDHEGQPITFDFDCSREEVICPSEVWPGQVSFRQDDELHPHRVWLQLPAQECDGPLVEPAPSECGPGTQNESCDPVCDGEMIATTKEAFGTINTAGDTFAVALGVGIASNGYNCALLGGSYAEGSLDTEGSAEEEDWQAVGTQGDVVTDYSGGCLMGDDVNLDGEVEAAVLGARVRLATGFTAVKQ